jgi:DNA (cytosine-5)-methyltransferase 1
VLKANADLLSCSKRDSAIHSEVVDLDAPSKTIICTYGHQPRLLVGLRKPDGTSYVRTLLPVELKQIQGFPADYKLTGSVSEQIIQIGNAVPPPMIECAAKAIRLAVASSAPEVSQ